ncbi:hypothetical protein SF301_4864 [Shigella flexneri 2a str. 301]|uniref:Uncharacterized protein n=1 Tax=Shigella flexneri 2a str. 301 TaxID=198214 RepID=A0AB36P7B1_SHIFL|nr:hypothetical protein SF301_4864 [Shigella flexneri 2a str. 301]
MAFIHLVATGGQGINLGQSVFLESAALLGFGCRDFLAALQGAV